MTGTGPSAGRLLVRAVRYLRPFPGLLAGKIGFGVVAITIALLLPWPLKILIDHVILGIPVDAPVHPYPPFVQPFVDPLIGASPAAILGWTVAAQVLLLVVVGAFGSDGRERGEANTYVGGGQDTATTTENEANAGFSFVGGLVGWIETLWTLRLTQALNHHYRTALFARLVRLPMVTLDDARIGDAIYRVMYDTPSVTNVCYRLALTPILAPLGLCVTAAALWLTFGNHPRLVLIALAFLPLSLLTTLPFARAIRLRADESRTAGSAATSGLEEGLGNLAALQALGATGAARARFDRESWHSFLRFRRLVALVLVTVAVAALAGSALGIAAFLHTVDLVVAGAFSPGDATLLFTYYGGVVYFAVELGALWVRVQGSVAGIARVFALMDLPLDDEPADGDAPPAVRERVALEHVGFAYPGGAPVLQDVSCELRVGEITAVVGPAGAGKTTLASLVAGFARPDEGRIRFDDTDVGGLALAARRRGTAYVFQEPALLDGSIADNVRLGRPEADDAEVARALELAGAAPFVEALPERTASPVGRSGGKLSVGQRQRVAIARALVRDAPVLILDEPTSALDPESERALIATLRSVRERRVVLVVTHRLALARAADHLLVVQHGRVVEAGRPAELAARPDGAYRRLVTLEAGPSLDV
jgi:ABC-type multidrug transport system fused ATPase/permease subunit